MFVHLICPSVYQIVDPRIWTFFGGKNISSRQFVAFVFLITERMIIILTCGQIYIGQCVDQMLKLCTEFRNANVLISWLTGVPRVSQPCSIRSDRFLQVDTMAEGLPVSEDGLAQEPKDPDTNVWGRFLKKL
jgi:hypothetical protein